MMTLKEKVSHFSLKSGRLLKSISEAVHLSCKKSIRMLLLGLAFTCPLKKS